MTTLSSRYDAILLDLDGTVYRGGSALPGAADAVTVLRRSSVAVAFVTNNASRTPDQVAEHLVGMGVHAQAQEIVTSAQAAAVLLADRSSPDDRVLVLGTEALVGEIAAVSLCPVREAVDDLAAVVQGHSPDTGWRQLAQACLPIRAGVLWVACNLDPTLPTEHGELPGNGSMVAALRTATGREPVVAGKPGLPLVNVSMARVDARHPLVVGDRLDTDVEAADAAGLDSLLVLSGVTDPATVLAAPPGRRPTYLAAGLESLAEDPESLRIDDRAAWRCEVVDGELVLHGDGSGADPLDALRALCAQWWRGGGGAARVTGAGDPAEEVLRGLGLDAAHGAVS